jgi:hypothetical protein
MRLLIASLSLMLFCSTANAQWSIEAETGVAFQQYNDVRIPNETGTLFDFKRDFSQDGVVIPFRLRPGYTFGEKNHIFGLVGILVIDYEGRVPFDIDFQDVTFTEEDGLVLGFYQFNSYRLTYRRDLIQTDNWILGLGATAKLRDATVRLGSGENTARKDDLGFVPLINFHLEYLSENWSLLIEGDGLAASQGRAFDIFAGARFNLVEDFSFKAGYRILEGGADVDKVYNFTLIHFASLGLKFDF